MFCAHASTSTAVTLTDVTACVLRIQSGNCVECLAMLYRGTSNGYPMLSACSPESSSTFVFFYATDMPLTQVWQTVSTSHNPSGYIVAKAEDLLTLFDADSGCLSVGNEAKILGQMENSQEGKPLWDHHVDQLITTCRSSNDFGVSTHSQIQVS